MSKPSQTVTIGLLAMLLLTACAPAGLPEAAPTETPMQQAAPSETPFQAAAEPTSTPEPEPVPTETVDQDPQPVATSRGPNLEATTPSTANLASGELQLVEFFRFT